ncbi:MAG: hypothetical protein DRG31_00490 [Deltaproteobacteria bacterium]|nr:MAG: hypothetical protein DRG31_00490 [Deltaproteobacteria bacterium]
MGKEREQQWGEVNGFLGRETAFEGKLDFKGAVRIEGNFKGEIRTPDLLIIGEGARVEGQIEVGTAIIQGEVLGNIRASKKVELRSSARLSGDISTPLLVVEEGAFFDGSCKMAEGGFPEEG